MAVGPHGNQVGIIIQARLGSTRLPGKTLLPMPMGSSTTLLERIIAMGKQAQGEPKVIVATTQEASDTEIEEICSRINTPCYRGSTDNVLERYLEAGRLFQADQVVRLTGDNPFIFPELIDQAVSYHLENQLDYTYTQGLPLGLNIEVVRLDALENVNAHGDLGEHREHVTSFIRTHPENFKTGTLQIPSLFPQARLTVDYASDYTLASTLYAALLASNRLNLTGLEEVLSNHPWLLEANEDNYQKKVFSSEHEESHELKAMLARFGMDRTLSRLFPDG